MKVYKEKIVIEESEEERAERRAKDMRAQTSEQLRREQETARRHTDYDDKKRRGTRKSLSNRAIRESME
jgi:hypothetical protein